MFPHGAIPDSSTISSNYFLFLSLSSLRATLSPSSALRLSSSSWNAKASVLAASLRVLRLLAVALHVAAFAFALASALHVAFRFATAHAILVQLALLGLAAVLLAVAFLAPAVEFPPADGRLFASLAHASLASAPLAAGAVHAGVA